MAFGFLTTRVGDDHRRIPVRSGRPRSATALPLLAVLGFITVDVARAQSPSTPPRSYSDYYYGTLDRNKVPSVNPRQSTIDRYFYHRPTISPYLNLLRRGGLGGSTNYQSYVVPEMQRRAKYDPRYSQGATARRGSSSRSHNPYAGRGNSGTGGSTGTAKHTQGFYYNHWYGQWKNGR